MGYTYGGDQLDAHLPFTDPEPAPKPVGESTRNRCGERAGYAAHRKAGEDPCGPCRTANTVYQAEYKARRRGRKITKGWTPAKCGTYAGHAAHRYHAVPMCDPCEAAGKLWRSEYNAAKKVTA